MLNSLTAFRNVILFLEDTNETLLAIKSLIREISISETTIETSWYLQQIGLRDYVFGMQYDAHECLIQILK